MKNENKTRKQLIQELERLRHKNEDLAESEDKRRRIEGALRASDERFRNLLENIDLGVALIDCEYSIVEVNAATGKMFDKPVSEFVGKKCYNQFEKRDAICPHCHTIRRMNSGHPVKVETEGVTAGGKRFNIRVWTFPTIDEDGSVIGYVEVMEDITEHKKNEEQIREHFEARLEAEKKQEKAVQMAAIAANLASIGVIAGGITHEINQPLSAIQVHTNTLLYLVEEKKYKLPEPFTKIFNEISEGIQRINNIIQHMRSFWLSADSESLEDIDFNETIKSALSLTNRKMLAHSIKLKQELTPQRISIKANRFQIEQIVINLVINAINALDKKTSVKKEILVKTSISNGKAVLKIHDNGIGLPTEEYEKLFSPFFSTKKFDDGMGLGLAIVKMFVDRFKSEIEAGANEEGGATFTVRFPAENYSENTE